MKSKKPSNTSSSKTKVNYSPTYPAKRISTIEVLALALGESLDDLSILLEEYPSQYRLKEEKKKWDGSTRRIFSLAPRLKALQKLINEKFLKSCRYPKYICGSIKGSDYIANAARHIRQSTVIKLDVTNFFPSISESIVEEIWNRFFNFSEDCSSTLRALCCHEGGLVQGAPVSSYLANLVFWDVEPLLAQQFEREGFIYTRYVDDIIVSHSRKLTTSEKTEVIKRVKWMLAKKGLKAKTRKTKVMDSGGPQDVHGLNVNGKRPTIPKSTRKKIRAAVNQFEKDVAGLPKKKALKMYDSLNGKLHNLKRLHPVLAEKLMGQISSPKSA